MPAVNEKKCADTSRRECFGDVSILLRFSNREQSYIYNIYIYYVTDRNKEGKAEGKRFNQMSAKWLNRSAFGWGTFYLASRVLGA